MCGFIGGAASAVVRFAAVIFLCADCAWASDFFHMGPVEYFPGSKRSMREGFRQAQKIMDWREPVLAPDGRTTDYVPPRPVADLLENPTPENARQYLAWQDEKIQRVLKAQEVLAAVEQEEQGH